MAFEISFESLVFSDLMAAGFGSLAMAALLRARGRAKQLADQERQRLGTLMDASPDAILQFDSTGTCLFASHASARLLEEGPAQLIGRSILGFAVDERDAMQAAFRRAQGGQASTDLVFRRLRTSGEQQWIEARLGPADAAGHFTAVLRDVSTRKTAELALRVANTELNKLAGTDGLTGLLNRRRFDQMLESECRRASRNGKPVTLLLVDVDRLKRFNDRHGQLAGDACLKQIAAVLRSVATRPTDLAARFSGEQMALVLSDFGEDEALPVAERLCGLVRDLRLGCKPGGVEPEPITVSIGCATLWPTHDDLSSAPSSLIAAADRALYEAKRLGRDRVFASAGSRPDAMVRMLATEAGRLARVDALRASGVLNASPVLHNVSRMAAVLLGMPVAFVALLDREEVRILGGYGLEEDALHLPFEFGAPLLGSRSALIVPRTAVDPRFEKMASAHGWASLAAAPLLSGDGLHHVGALWVADRQPREPLDKPKTMLLSRLASLVMEDLDARCLIEPPVAGVA